MKRRFEFEEDGSAQFWEVTVEKQMMTIRYGRLGTDGQTKDKEFDSPEKAAAEAKALISEKTKKGYREVGMGGRHAESRLSRATSKAASAGESGGSLHDKLMKGMRATQEAILAAKRDKRPLARSQRMEDPVLTSRRNSLLFEKWPKIRHHDKIIASTQTDQRGRMA